MATALPLPAVVNVDQRATGHVVCVGVGGGGLELKSGAARGRVHDFRNVFGETSEVPGTI